MAAASYTTDMTSINDGQSGTWVEMTGWANGGTPQVNTTEWYIQGTGCVTATYNNKTTIQSVAFNNGSDLSGSFSAGDVIMMWQAGLAGGALDVFDNGGLRFIEGQTQAIFKAANIGGSDYDRNPYGGFANVVYASQIETLQTTIDVNGTNGTFTRSAGSFLTDGFEPGHAIVTQGFTNGGNNSNFVISTVTATVITVTDNTGMVTETGGGNETIVMGDYIVGTLSGTRAAQYFGSGLLPQSAVSKGEMHCVDEISYGRGQIKATDGDLSNGYATFLGMATENDYNDATNGYNRWGLFSLQKGSYIWKGLISLGDDTTSVDFRDSNRAIVVEDTSRAYLDFNRIEIRHASSRVDWTNVSFLALGTLSPGTFEMHAAADVNLDGCLFQNMYTFIFLSTGDAVNCTWVSCKMITGGGGLFNGSKVLTSDVDTDASAFSWDVATDPDGYLDNMIFSKGTNAHHAITFGSSTPTTINLNGIDFQGFNASDGQNDSALYFPDTGSDVAWVVNASGCTGNIKYKKVRAGDTVTINLDQVSHTLTGLINASEVTYVTRGAAVDTGSDGSSTANSRNFVTTNTWTVDAYKGHLLEITSGADAGRYYCSGNSATTLYLDKELSATASSLTWELYDEGDDTIPFHVESVTGNQSQYTYTYVSDVVVDIMIQHVNYQEIVLEKVTLGNTSQSIPQVQIPDQNYLNP